MKVDFELWALANEQREVPFSEKYETAEYCI